MSKRGKKGFREFVLFYAHFLLNVMKNEIDNYLSIFLQCVPLTIIALLFWKKVLFMLTDVQRFIVKDMEINFVVMSYGFYSLPNNATKVDACHGSYSIYFEES